MDSGEPLIVRAIYLFNPSNNDELSFKKGDLITVTQKDEGWWEGTLNGKTGWFPSNYVKECKDVPKPSINPQNQYKEVVLKDLIDSEKAYVTELEGLVTNFLQPLEKNSILTSDEYKQLTGNINEVLDVHQQLLNLIESESTKPGLEQRVGRLFLTWAPRVKNVYQVYCSLHPRAVCILDKYKDELTKYMESKGASSPGVLVLTVLLSKPFRRLDKYSGMLQELERHVEESHPDRGDTQRSVAVYKEIANTCSATRRQKELELQVLSGPIRGWEGPPVSTLGEIIYMGSVAVGSHYHDRYFVLFPSVLVILAVSHRLSAFIFEGKLYLSGINVTRLEDSDEYKNAFEISGSLIEKRIAICQSKDEANHWVELLTKQQKPRSSNDSVASNRVRSSPHGSHSLNQRGYCNRTSVLIFNVNINYKPTYPPEIYPSASPYAALTKFYHKKIKEKHITTNLLKQLLYSEYMNKNNRNLVKLRTHKSECVIMTKNVQCRISVINCDNSSDEDNTTTTSSTSSDFLNIKRQNAVDKTDSSDDSSSSSNPFGYIRYYNPQTGSNRESIVDYGPTITTTTIADSPKMSVMEPEEKKTNSILLTSSTSLQILQKQWSDNSDASSNFNTKPSFACEDLAHIDGNIELNTLNLPQDYMPTARQSCPTKLVGNKFNESSLTTIYIPSSWSNSDTNLMLQKKQIEQNNNRKSGSSTTTHSSSLELIVNPVPVPDNVLAEILYNFNDDFQKSESVETVIKPPTMFQNDEAACNLSLQNIGFRTHSINSDKPKTIRRRSIQIDTENMNRPIRRCVSTQFLRLETRKSTTTTTTSTQSFCRCCLEHNHSPRSSDSGMAGSCTLNSPDLGHTGEDRFSNTDMMEQLYHKYSDLIDGCGSRNVISLSEIQARDFESECVCTSPFGSTPRTSCQPLSNNVLTGSYDCLRTSVASNNTDGNNRTICPNSNIEQHTNEIDEKIVENEQPMIYKSGLYAHWWLKAKIPANVIKGIYDEVKSSTTNDATTTTTTTTTITEVHRTAAGDVVRQLPTKQQKQRHK